MKREAFIVLVNLAYCLGVITFITPPFNTTAGVGHTATIACIVSGVNTATEHVKWKREGQTAALTLDGTNVGDARYQNSGKYNLTIANVTKADEGGYVCEAGAQTKTAYLSVVEFPNNVTVYWATPPIANTIANLTCKATRANPAPNFSWYKDGRYYSNNAAVTFTTPSYPAGYVDAYSALPVTLTVGDQFSKFRCEIDYTGVSNVMQAEIVTTLASSGIRRIANLFILAVCPIFALLIWK